MFGIEVWQELAQAGERPRRGRVKVHLRDRCPSRRAAVVKLATIPPTSCLFSVSELVGVWQLAVNTALEWSWPWVVGVVAMFCVISEGGRESIIGCFYRWSR
jgi:hypothetical protein